MTDIDGTVRELAALWPALTAALIRDTATPDGGTAGYGWLPSGLVNADVEAAIHALDQGVPAAVRWACEDTGEPWRHRRPGEHLRQIPRLASRMRDLGLARQEKTLGWLAASWLRMVKRALGLREPDVAVGDPPYDCPWAGTNPGNHPATATLYKAGREGFLRPGPDGPWVQWVDSGLIYCASDECGASWGPAQWPMLGRMLRAEARGAALAGAGLSAKPGVGRELGRPACRLSVVNHPLTPGFLGRQVAALDFPLDGVTRRGGHRGNLGGGEHAIMVTRLRRRAQLG